MADAPPRDQTRTPTDWMIDRAAAGAMGLGRRLPAALQARLAQALAARTFAHQKDRAVLQLGQIWPQLDAARCAAIARGSVENVIRGTFEIADNKRLLARARAWEPGGLGLAHLEAAREDRRAVILTTGHFGNWEAARAALTHRGFEIGGLYRPLNNGFLDDRWKTILSGLSGPVFPRGRQGLRGLLRHLKNGGMAVLLPDQYVSDGTPLPFLGQPAPTSLAAAELALRFDAPLIPFYGIRRGNGFDVVIEEPIAPDTPEAMMRAFNDSLSARVTADPEQWLWAHRRWKHYRAERRKKT